MAAAGTVDDGLVTAGWGHACALSLPADPSIVVGGTPICWGRNDRRQCDAPQGALLLQVAASDDFTCGVSVSRRIVCWGAVPVALLVTLPPLPLPHERDARADGSGSVNAVAVAADGSVTAPPEAFAHISVGSSHVCGILLDGRLRCYGDDHLGQASPPPGLFSQVSCGNDACCGVEAPSGSIACWGSNRAFVHAVPQNVYSQVSVAAGGSACALATAPDAGIVCWGRMLGGVSQPLWRPGHFALITATDDFVCASLFDGRLDCFGHTRSMWHQRPRRRALDGREIEPAPPELVVLEMTSHRNNMCLVYTAAAAPLPQREPPPLYAGLDGASAIETAAPVEAPPLAPPSTDIRVGCWDEDGMLATPPELQLALY